MKLAPRQLIIPKVLACAWEGNNNYSYYSTISIWIVLAKSFLGIIR